MSPAPRQGWTGGFTHRPSLLGWILLLSPGLIIGAAIAVVFKQVFWLGAIIGAILVWRIALYLDWRKWKDKLSDEQITFEIDVANVAELDQITARLRTLGVVASGREAVVDDSTRFYLTTNRSDRAAVEKEIGWV